MTFVGLPIGERILLMAFRSLISHELQVFLRRFLAGGSAPEGWMIFEGNDFFLAKASLVWTRAGEDVATIGFHCVPIRDGLPAGSPASDDELDQITARIVTLWAALDGFYPAEQILDRIVYHNAGPQVTDENGRLRGIDYNPDGSRVPGQGVANAARRTDLVGTPGNSAADTFLPPQVAMSATLKTQFRRQWGRVYLPAGDTGTLVSSVTHAGGIGQITPGAVASIRTAFGNLLEGLVDDDTPMVIWSTKHQHALSVDQVQVDSLFDVIRSRRYDRAMTVETHTVGA